MENQWLTLEWVRDESWEGGEWRRGPCRWKWKRELLFFFSLLTIRELMCFIYYKKKGKTWGALATHSPYVGSPLVGNRDAIKMEKMRQCYTRHHCFNYLVPSYLLVSNSFTKICSIFSPWSLDRSTPHLVFIWFLRFKTII